MTIHLSIDLRASNRPKLGYVLRCFEWYGKSAPTRGEIEGQLAPRPDVRGLPDYTKLIYPDYVPLIEAWQWYQWEVFRRSAPHLDDKELGAAMAGIFKGDRAFTNKKGPDNGYACYPAGVNVDAAPMEFEPGVGPGSVVRIIAGPSRVGGQDAYHIQTFDTFQSPPNIRDVNPDTHPWMFFYATSSCREGWLGGYKWASENIQEPFWQLGGADVRICLRN